MQKTKIVCTIGPASEKEEVLEAMILNGMNVARLNFSHGSHQDHLEKIILLRKLSASLQKPVAILLDLAGPKIRIGQMPDSGVLLEPGHKFILTNRDVEGSVDAVSLSHKNLPREVKPGDRLLLADGLMELFVEATGESDIICKVVTGGTLTSHKGINLPTGTISTSALTEKDRADLLFGLENDVDFIALSFVKNAEDIMMIKDIIAANGKDTPVIAKIEKHEALNHIDAILKISDGIMVARGDLGVEIPLEDVPLIQKRLIYKANMCGKPVITATQMLRSMVTSPRPTRAEAADVANAVLDGTDAVMLSEETASGNYPAEAVMYLSRLATVAESGYAFEKFLSMIPEKDISESVAHASSVLASHLSARAIVAYTQSGRTARYISRFRPRQPIIALSPKENTVRRLALSWGCRPRLINDFQDTDDMIEKATQAACDAGEVSAGDLIVITVGHPLWVSGTTNMLRVKRVK
ncbi:MAG: pyruvate kinase [Deltaproteobacteria bacterium HGW-Deltaproteobacteria-12]|jgi:pyruvate kinase|nr:MAG: pyruvate kinase [Deltaproteobacteria bacterium HGW-Deltaproteobacteria-12]